MKEFRVPSHPLIHAIIFALAEDLENIDESATAVSLLCFPFPY